jgi:cobalt-zinc-cadmium resistance protein CzcA
MSTGAGSEVQRPLATVVVVGIAASTLLTSLVFPAILSVALLPSRARDAAPVEAPPDTSGALS